MVDHMAHDGLFCAFDQVAMGVSTEKYNGRYGVTREEQDAFSARSHQRAAEGRRERCLRRTRSRRSAIPQRKGDPVLFSTDEGVRADTTADALGKLRPAFAADGTITAGSASQISDGAAAVVVMSKAKAEELGLELDRRDRRPRRRRGPGREPARAAVQRDQGRAAPRRASTPPTST